VPLAGVWLAAAIVLGACAAPWCAPLGASGVLLLALTTAASVVAYVRRARPWPIVVLVLAACALAAGILTQRARAAAVAPSLRLALDERFGGFLLEDHDGPTHSEPVRTRATLREDAGRRDGFVSLRVKVIALQDPAGWRTVDGGAALTVSGDVPAGAVASWHAGATLELPVTYRRPARFLNDGVPNDELARALGGTSVLGTVKSRWLIDVIDEGGWLDRVAASARRRVRQVVATAVGRHDAVSGAVVTAVLIGDDSGLPDDLRERWQMAGTYHVLAISGGNIAVVVVLAVAGGLLTGRSPRTAACVALIVLAIFAVVVTSGVSVRRATLMAALHLLARAIDHRTSSWQALASAAAVMIVADPLSLRDAGFLLTCGATLALIATAGVAMPALASRPAPIRWLAVSVAATVAVEAVVFPIGLWFFGRVSLAGIALNIVAVPLMTVAQVAGLACVALDVMGAGADAVGGLAHYAVSVLDWCTTVSQRVPGVAWQALRPSVPLLIVYYAALGAWWVGPRAWTRAAGTVAVCVACALATAPTGFTAPWKRTNHLTLTIFDVGQGESILVETDGGRLLVDAGGRPFGEGTEIGRRVLVPALWARGATSLDALLITHADPDHVGGAGAVFDAVSPRALWLGVDVPNHPPAIQLRGRAVARGVPVVHQRVGRHIAWGGARIRVLHPPEPDWERRRVRNDDSVVLEVLYGNVAVLLAGDISAEVERRILPTLTPAAIRVLKVAHHGSRTSSTAMLLESWRPDVALVSCGRGNSFGHPTPEVLTRLAAVGATVLRTDADGQITLWSDGRVVRARTYRGRQFWARPPA